MLPDALNLSSIKKPDLRIQNENLGSFFINNNEKDDNISKSYRTDDILMYDVSVHFFAKANILRYIFYNKLCNGNNINHKPNTAYGIYPPPLPFQQSPQNNKKRLNEQ